MKKNKRTPQQFADTLIESLMIVFDGAYLRHMNGESEEALILEHDILAANALHAESIRRCHRQAITSAVSAVEEKIPFAVARSYMLKKLHERAEELIREGQS